MLGLTLDDETNGLHAGLQFERNGLDRRHFGLDTYRGFMNRTCQWVSVVKLNATHIL